MKSIAQPLKFFRRKNFTIVLDPLSPNWITVNREGETVLRQLLSGLSRDEMAIGFCRRRKFGLREGLPVIDDFISEITPFLDGKSAQRSLRLPGSVRLSEADGFKRVLDPHQQPV